MSSTGRARAAACTWSAAAWSAGCCRLSWSLWCLPSDSPRRAVGDAAYQPFARAGRREPYPDRPHGDKAPDRKLDPREDHMPGVLEDGDVPGFDARPDVPGESAEPVLRGAGRVVA